MPKGLLGAQEAIKTWCKNEEVQETARGKKFIDYSRLCLHYRLDEENLTIEADGSTKDHTYEKLLKFEKLGYIFKDALFLCAGCNDLRARLFESTARFFRTPANP